MGNKQSADEPSSPHRRALRRNSSNRNHFTPSARTSSRRFEYHQSNSSNFQHPPFAPSSSGSLILLDSPNNDATSAQDQPPPQTQQQEQESEPGQEFDHESSSSQEFLTLSIEEVLMWNFNEASSPPPHTPTHSVNDQHDSRLYLPTRRRFLRRVAASGFRRRNHNHSRNNSRNTRDHDTRYGQSISNPSIADIFRASDIMTNAGTRNNSNSNNKHQGLYPNVQWDEKVVRKLILHNQVAPRYPGQDEGDAVNSEECPICMLYYPALNTSCCCRQGICTECYLQVSPQKIWKREPCPFCKNKDIDVVYDGVKTAQVKRKEASDRRGVEEALEAAREEQQRQAQVEEEKLRARLREEERARQARQGADAGIQQTIQQRRMQFMRRFLQHYANHHPPTGAGSASGTDTAVLHRFSDPEEEQSQERTAQPSAQQISSENNAIPVIDDAILQNFQYPELFRQGLLSQEELVDHGEVSQRASQQDTGTSNTLGNTLEQGQREQQQVLSSSRGDQLFGGLGMAADYGEMDDSDIEQMMIEEAIMRSLMDEMGGGGGYDAVNNHVNLEKDDEEDEDDDEDEDDEDNEESLAFDGVFNGDPVMLTPTNQIVSFPSYNTRRRPIRT